MKYELVGSDAFQKAVKTSVQPLLGTIWKVSALLVQLIIYISLSFYIVQFMCCIIFANRAHLATPFVFLTSFCSCDDRWVRKGNSTSFTNTTPLSEIDDVGHWTSNRTLHIHSQNSRHSGWGMVMWSTLHMKDLALVSVLVYWWFCLDHLTMTPSWSVFWKANSNTDGKYPWSSSVSMAIKCPSKTKIRDQIASKLNFQLFFIFYVPTVSHETRI